MKLIKVKIEIIIEVADISEGCICDTVSAILSENLMHNNIITDWQYSPKTNPEFIGEFTKYKEGDGF